MTQPTIESPPQTGGGGFRQKIMGIPAWGWLAIAAVGGAAILLWRRGGTPAQENAVPAGFVPPADSQSPEVTNEEFQTLLAQIRDIQGKLSEAAEQPTPTPTPTPATGTTATPDGPAPGSGRGYGWVKMLPGDTTIAKAVDRANKVLPTNPAGGFNQTLYILYNGPMNPVPGQYIKVRGRSNPVMGPYYGK